MAQIRHVRGAADEAGGDKVKILFHAEENILPVPLAEIWHGKAHAGDVDPLVIFDASAVFHPADDILASDFQHREADKPVVQQNRAAGNHVAGKVPVGDGADMLVSRNVAGGEDKVLTFLQLGAAFLEIPQANFGALGVQHGGHGKIQLLPKRFHHVQPRLVFGMGAVGKVKPGHIQSGLQHGAERFLLVGGGTQSTDNFCLSHINLLVSWKQP
ncbi:hypothetical protein SDC9_65302 [bioreactor metagenome]|uniref:Uncharacterized protein n=1 Tax=bioreactor metagenome TaxID=1076179 RepID=A0A644XXV5_9ZZZZ